MDLMHQFRSDVHKFLKKNKLSKTTMGLMLFDNPHSIFRWTARSGDPKLSAVYRVYKFMEKYEKDKKCRRRNK